MAMTKILMSGLLVTAVVCIAAIFVATSANNGNGTELVYAFMVHRHGDRTPIKEADMIALNLFNNNIKALIEKWGFGQITDAGLKTMFKTGEFIRRRYHDLISPKYNDSEIYIRSSDMTRTKVSVLSAMAAVYRPDEETWSKDIPWVPAPYTTVPGKEDFIQPWYSCPNFIKLFGIFKESSTLLRTSKNGDVATKLVHLLGNKDIENMPLRMVQIYDICTALISMGYDVGDDILKLYPELSTAADDTWDYLFGLDIMLPLLAGVLLDEFFVHANEIISGKDTHNVRVYSAHDVTVYALIAATGVTRQGIPNYGSLFSLELRRDVETGRYFILPVYLSDPHEGVEKYLQVEGCGEGFLCDYEQFGRITAKYRLDEDAWKTKCFADEEDTKVS